ncbi:uncharacterized protein [Mobula birostris]|uniref:uncharacterized protein n=1 Tax=Mobula birostris TaxID=1983395 RepID=UPI003B280BE3
MEDSETYMNVKFTETDSRSPSRDCLTSTYSEVNFRKVEPRIDKDEDPLIASGPGGLPTTAQSVGLTSTYSELNFRKDESLIVEDEYPPMASGPGWMPATAQTVGLTSTYSELNFRKDKPLIEDNEDPPIASGPGVMPTTAQTGAHEQESKRKMGNRPHRQIYLLCLVTSALIIIVAGLSIHLSQIRQSQTTLDRNCHELNSTLQSTMSEISDLRHRFTQMETKYKLVNDSMAQICEFLISGREESCPGNWTENADRCYFISTLEKSYDAARNHCSNVDASLLEINSNKEKDFVSNSTDDEHGSTGLENAQTGM